MRTLCCSLCKRRGGGAAGEQHRLHAPIMSRTVPPTECSSKTILETRPLV
jgi:hypothetical protein